MRRGGCGYGKVDCTRASGVAWAGVGTAARAGTNRVGRKRPFLHVLIGGIGAALVMAACLWLFLGNVLADRFDAMCRADRGSPHRSPHRNLPVCGGGSSATPLYDRYVAAMCSAGRQFGCRPFFTLAGRGRENRIACRSLAALSSVPERVLEIASSRRAGRRKSAEADLARNQAARTPDAVAWRPRHNAGVMVAAGLGRSSVWGRSVAGQLWSPWDIPRGNQRECRRVGSWPVVVPLGYTQGKPDSK